MYLVIFCSFDVPILSFCTRFEYVGLCYDFVRYFGLSSTGITYKSGSASFSSGSFQSGDRYGGIGSTKNGDSFRDSYKDRDRYDEDKFEQSTSVKPRRDSESSQGKTSRKGSSRHGRFPVISFTLLLLKIMHSYGLLF